jgi:tetratricopeptide (TPR) repeat protein
MDSSVLPEQTQSLPGRVRWWWRGRNWKTFRLAAPAVFVGLVIVILTGVCATQSPRELQARYLAHGKAAFEAKDYQRALTCYERVAPTADPDVLYWLALTAYALGDHGRAATLIRGLAPDDKSGTGYAPAHFWRARQVLASSTADSAVALSEHHLERALEGDLGADRQVAQALLGKLYLIDKRGRLDDAERLLTQAAPTIRETHFDLAQLYLVRGNAARSRQEAELAVRFFRERVKADSNDHLARLSWAKSAALLEDFPGAAAILTDGLAATNEPIYRAALANMYAGWYDFQKKQAASANDLLALLDKGLNYDPASPDLLNRLIEQLQVRGTDADKARETLRGLLARGTVAPAHVHFALAVDAQLRSAATAKLRPALALAFAADPNSAPAPNSLALAVEVQLLADAAEAKLHLEMAFAADPKSGAVANGLAHVLSQPPNPDLQRALATVKLALDQEPNNPHFLDTRAHIYMGLGRWKDAAIDLEAVLARVDAASVHAALATAYEKLGQRELADKHRRHAAESTQKPPAKP